MYGGLQPASIGIWQLLLEQQHQAGIQGNMLEIGVFEGAAAAMLAAHLGESEQNLGLDIYINRPAIDQCISHVDERLLSRLTFHTGDSRQLWRNGVLDGQRGSFRFLHIDGEHSYDAVRSDLELCEQMMTGDAVVVVDDVLSAESVCVTHALFDYLRDRPHRLRMFLCGANKAYLCLPSKLEYYRTLCLDSLVPFVEEMTGEKLRLAKNSHAWEIDYLSVAPRGEGASYMRINQYLDHPPR